VDFNGAKDHPGENIAVTAEPTKLSCRLAHQN